MCLIGIFFLKKREAMIYQEEIKIFLSYFLKNELWNFLEEKECIIKEHQGSRWLREYMLQSLSTEMNSQLIENEFNPSTPHSNPKQENSQIGKVQNFIYQNQRPKEIPQTSWGPQWNPFLDMDVHRTSFSEMARAKGNLTKRNLAKFSHQSVATFVQSDSQKRPCLQDQLLLILEDSKQRRRMATTK